MRLGILSDTHDELAFTQRAVRMLRREGAETLVHCGDLTGPEIVRACAVLPCFFAFGNHDAAEDDIARAPWLARPANPRYLLDMRVATSYARQYAVTLADGSEVEIRCWFKGSDNPRIDGYQVLPRGQ